jgi:hypothetical protein
VITITNNSGEPMLVRHSGDPEWYDVVKPLSELKFSTVMRGHWIIERSRTRTPERFDPRGGDPYNRTGTRAFS